MEVTDLVKLDVLFKRYLNKSSTSIRKNWFEEREAPESLYPIHPNLQLYTQWNLLTEDVPPDVQTLTDTGQDDLGNALAGSFVGKTSLAVSVLRRYIKLPLVPVPSPCGKAFMAPKCITMQIAANYAVGEVIVGNTTGARATVVKTWGAYVFFKFFCGSQICFQAGETVVGRTSTFSAVVVQDSRTCPYSRVMRDLIPFDYGRGGYAYKIYRNNGSPVYFGEGNWLMDVYSGVLTFYGTCPNGVSDSLPPSISFYRYIGKKGLNTTHSTNGWVGIGTDYPKCSLDVHTTDAIGIPAGTTDQRPDPAEQGFLRFNLDSETFEGFLGCCQWTDLTKGIGWGSDPVNIATGGVGRNVTIGNNSGPSSISLVSGSGDISLNTAAAVFVNANSSVSIQTRGPGGSSINIGSAADNQTIRLIATGSNSSIQFIGPTNLQDASDISLAGGAAYYYADTTGEGNWRGLQIPSPADPTTTSLVFQKLISGSWTTRFRID